MGYSERRNKYKSGNAIVWLDIFEIIRNSKNQKDYLLRSLCINKQINEYFETTVHNNSKFNEYIDNQNKTQFIPFKDIEDNPPPKQPIKWIVILKDIYKSYLSFRNNSNDYIPQIFCYLMYPIYLLSQFGKIILLIIVLNDIHYYYLILFVGWLLFITIVIIITFYKYLYKFYCDILWNLRYDQEKLPTLSSRKCAQLLRNIDEMYKQICTASIIKDCLKDIFGIDIAKIVWAYLDKHNS